MIVGFIDIKGNRNRIFNTKTQKCQNLLALINCNPQGLKMPERNVGAPLGSEISAVAEVSRIKGEVVYKLP